MRHSEQSSVDGKEAQAPQHAGVNPMEEWLAHASVLKEVERGDIVDGTIVSVSPTEILVDIGCKAEGVISGKELERMTPEELSEIRVGDRLPVFVVNPEDYEGNVVLSISRARSARDWRRAQELLESQEIFQACVTDCNKGGVIVGVGRLRGFVPASQLLSEGRDRRESPEREDGRQWEYLIGQTINLKVIEVDRERNRLILSERAAVRESRQGARQKLLSQLQVGSICRGVVTSLCDFGAFVDLGGADGLVHLSELSWEKVSHPREVLREGQEVEVYVVDIDREKQRIGLSLRRLASQPWQEVADHFVVGQIVQGTITKIVNFGAFARIADGVEGLIHISELSEGRVNHPHEIVREGDVVSLKVIRIDPERRRIGLSLKQARDEVDFDWREELKAGRPEDEEPASAG